MRHNLIRKREKTLLQVGEVDEALFYDAAAEVAAELDREQDEGCFFIDRGVLRYARVVYADRCLLADQLPQLLVGRVLAGTGKFSENRLAKGLLPGMLVVICT